MRTGAALSVSSLCLAAACAFPSYGFSEPDPLASICTDGKPSSAETGIDCGGGCPRCPIGQACKSGNDCDTGACAGGVCQPATCSDGFANGSETDLDCGGTCVPCGTFRHCIASSDCVDQSCVEGVCAPVACNDAQRNGNETGRDCGGACPPCAVGYGCAVATDCMSGKCDQNLCVSLPCTNGSKDVAESDIDCGGAACAPCAAGKHCDTADDCGSSFCEPTAHTCVESACDDGVLNGSESAQDCGGTACPGCNDLAACRSPADCNSGVCQSGLCVPNAPTGAKLARTGWTYTASDSYANVKPTDMFDGDDKTWWSSGGPQTRDQWLEIDMQALQPLFAIALETHGKPHEYPVKFQLYTSRDGTFGEPIKDGVYGAEVSKVTFDSPIVARYVKVVLAQDSSPWWSVGEFRVYQ